MRKLISINRPTWLRGQDNSKLYRPSDGLMCCIGQALNQCGVSTGNLSLISNVNDLINHMPVNEIPKEFLALHKCNCEKCERRAALENELLVRAYRINDDKTTSDSEKEAALKPIFDALGFDVEFVN